jgi:hypothetical protein
VVRRRVGDLGDVEPAGQEADAAVDLAQALLAVEVVAVLRAVAVLRRPGNDLHHLRALDVEQRHQLLAQPAVTLRRHVVARARGQRRRQRPFVVVIVDVDFLGEGLAHRLRRGRRRYGSWTVACPAELNWIVPPHTQLSVDVSPSAGAPPSVTVGAPGDHGAGVAGTQGIGVKVPEAAAVAAATAGLDGLRHRPKGRMLTSGTWSPMFAAGPEAVSTGLGVGMKDAGAAPIEHVIEPPMQV